MTKLSDYVLKFVADLGVKHVFLLPGGGCMHLVDSLGKNPDLTAVCTLHEQAAAIAAGAYSQYTNNIGVALVTTGPGGTNALTGVAAAWIDSVPVLILSGQVKRSDRIGNSGVRQMGPQEVDIVPIVTPITKYAATVLDPLTIRHHLEKACHISREGRPGPVWIEIPLDIQGAEIEEGELLRSIPDAPPGPSSEGVSDVQAARIFDLLNESRRPVLLAGNGIRVGGAEGKFTQLVERLGVPVLLTWRAMDLLPEDHPLFFGRPGSIGQRGANFSQQNSDFIMTIGARLDLGQLGYSHANFARGAKKVVVDVDEAEIRKLQTAVDVPVVATSKDFIGALLRCCDRHSPQDLSPWLSLCREWKEKYPVILSEYRRQHDKVNTYVLVDVLSGILTKNDVLVPGSSGSCSEVTLQAFKVKRGQRILNSPGLGAMGFGLPESIGACLASGKRVVTIIGDGGFQLNIQELETISRFNLPIKMFILNNNGYASIRNTQRNYFEGRLVCCDPSSGLTLPELRRIASAYRIPFRAITGHRQIDKKVRDVLDTDGPVICEVHVNPDQPTAPRITSEIREDGTIVSKPLEDLWPFLDREEFHANMLIPALGD